MSALPVGLMRRPAASPATTLGTHPTLDWGLHEVQRSITFRAQAGVSGIAAQAGIGGTMCGILQALGIQTLRSRACRRRALGARPARPQRGQGFRQPSLSTAPSQAGVQHAPGELLEARD